MYSIWNYDTKEWIAEGQKFPRKGMSEKIRKDPSGLLFVCPKDLKADNGDRLGWFKENRVYPSLETEQKYGTPVWSEYDYNKGTVTITYPAVNLTKAEKTAKLIDRTNAFSEAATKKALEVDNRAGKERLKYTSLQIPGQSEVYSRKYQEAVAWTADKTSPTPYLTKEASATGKTLAQRVALVLATGEAWLTIDTAIEANRMGLKEEIIEAIALATDESTPDVEAAETALNAVDVESGWPV